MGKKLTFDHNSIYLFDRSKSVTEEKTSFLQDEITPVLRSSSTQAISNESIYHKNLEKSIDWKAFNKVCVVKAALEVQMLVCVSVCVSITLATTVLDF